MRRLHRAAGSLAIAALCWLSFSLSAYAQETLAPAPEEQSIDAWIDSNVGAITEPFVQMVFAPFPGTDVPWILFWLVIAAVVFTTYFSLIQIRGFRHSIELVRGDYADPNDAGEVSHFQALATALSGTVGLGNIAGVAVAVSIGGPGATFWMIVAGFMGMATKFTECTLAVRYRNEYPDGTVSGGPMYYLSKGLAKRGMAIPGRILAVLFAIFCVIGSFGAGPMFQSNQVHAQLVNVSGGTGGLLDGYGWLTGVVLASVVFAVIIGGIKSIAHTTERLVPFMAVLYVVSALVILVLNADKVPWAFGQIIEGAFTGLGIAGGFLGAMIQGFRRAAFSNEAGLGSAAIAHAAVKTKEPITEGFVSLLEPFIDTVVICTMTALVIIVTGVLKVDPATGLYVWSAQAGQIVTEGNLTGVELTSLAFQKNISWFPYVLAVAVILFAFSTIISWSYYGLKAWTYMVGESKIAEIIFKMIYCTVVVIGASMEFGAVIGFTDAAVFSMAVMNIIGLYILMPEVKEELRNYMARLEAGEIRKTVTT